MVDKILIRCYTKSDFYQWVIKGVNNGLDCSVLSKNRAIAQMNNPDADDCDILLTVAKIGKNSIGFKGVLPENVFYKGKRIKVGWGSTYYVNPNYRGQGIARMLLEPFIDYYSVNLGSIHSSGKVIELHKKLGWRTSSFSKTTFIFKIYKPRYLLGKPIKRFLVNISRPILNYVIGLEHKRWLKKSYKHQYKVDYIDIIDDKLYQFIENNRDDYLFNKSQERLNWILKYKWAITSPCIERVDKKYYFTDYVKCFFQTSVRVKYLNNTVGLYILRIKDGHMTIPHIFFNEENKKVVFRSILEHLIELRVYSLTTSNSSLINYVNDSDLKLIKKVDKFISYNHTDKEYFNNDVLCLQDGDGDSFF